MRPHGSDFKRLQEGHEGEVNALTFSYQGRLLASGGSDRRIKLWDVNHGESINPFTAESDPSLLHIRDFARFLRANDRGIVFLLT